MSGNREPEFLVDTNLLVLLAVGTVNRDRIESFKRTRHYSKADYDLLARLLARSTVICTTPHVVAEVSNLIDMPGAEGMRAREFLKAGIKLMKEYSVPSAKAADEEVFQRLGLTDASIVTAARENGCVVWTDDIALYLSLQRAGVQVVNFTYERNRRFGP